MVRSLVYCTSIRAPILDYIMLAYAQPFLKLIAGLSVALALAIPTLVLRAQTPGSVDPNFNPNLDNYVFTIAPEADGKIVFGGDFRFISGTSRNRAARVLANGTLDASYDPDVNNTVWLAASQPDGKALIGGAFGTVGGVAQQSIARLNSNGSRDGSFATQGNGTCRSVALQADGKLIIGGQYTMLGGLSRFNSARLNTDGSLDSSYTASTNAYVYAVAVQSNGRILLGGKFGQLNGETRNYLGRVSAASNVDTTFDPRPDYDVLNLVVQPDGKILVGGLFDRIGIDLTTRYGIARIDPDGTVDATFNPDAGSAISASVYGIALQADGKMILVGGFTTIGGVTRNRIARLNADGSLDPNFNPNANAEITAVALQGDGRVLVGGGFTSVGGVARNRIARIENDPAIQILTVPDKGQIRWMRGGSTPEALSVSFEFSSDGNNWSMLGAGTRIAGGWKLDALNLPTTGQIRARARTACGSNGLGIVEQIAPVSLPRNGTLAVAPASPVRANAPLTATFANWVDEDAPFTYQLFVNGNAVGAPLNTAAIPFTSPSTNGVHAITGRVFDAGGAYSEISTSLTVDAVPPQLTAISIASSNTVPGLAKVGDTVTATFSTNEAVIPGTVKIAGVTAAVAGSGTQWSAAVAVTGTFPDGAAAIEIQYQDIAGNPGIAGTATTNGSLVTIDRTPPVVSLTGAASFPVEAGGVYVEPGATAQDAIAGNVSGTIQISGSVNVAIPGTYPLIYTATDPAGNSGNITRMVQVVDTTAPTVAGPFAPLVLVTGIAGDVSLPDYVPQANTSDVVGVTSVTQFPLPGSLRQAGVATVTITAADAAGNSRSVQFAVQVNDGTNPTIAAPPGNFTPSTLTTGVGGTASLPDYTTQAVTSDNVAVTGVTQVPAPGSAQAFGTTSVILTAMDAAGNSRATLFDVTVLDGTQPEIAAPNGGFLPATVTTGPDGTASLPDYRAQAVTSDNVGVVAVTQSPLSGTAHVFGTTNVTLTAVDAAGNSRAIVFAIPIRDGTAPTISGPAENFTPLVLVTGPDSTALLPDYTAQAVTGDNVGVVVVTQSPPPGSAHPFGTTAITLTALDLAGNASSVQFDVSVADGTLPTISAPDEGFTPLAITADENGTALLPDYTAQAVTGDNVGVLSVTQSPLPGTVRVFGKSTVTLTAHDAAGNSSPLAFDIFVRLDQSVFETLATTKSAVPGAGVDPRIPADAVLASVGIPAVDDVRRPVFLAKWKSASGLGMGIFAGSPPTLITAAGGQAPGVSDATFASINDPILSPGGELIFAAAMRGQGITPANNEGLWIVRDGVITLLMRKGDVLPGGGRISKITNMSHRDGETIVMAKLARVRGVITAGNDTVLLRVTADGVAVLLQTGTVLDLDDREPPSSVTKIGALIPVAGSPANARTHADGTAIVHATLANRRTALLAIAPNGSITRTLVSGDSAPEAGSAAYWSALGLPAIGSNGSTTVFKGALKANSAPGNPATISKKNDDALAANTGAGFGFFAREQDVAPGAGALFAGFSDPVVNDQGIVAFLGKLAAPGATARNNSGIWWGLPGSITLLARIGSAAPDQNGNPDGPLFSKFISLALPDGDAAGPVFVAQVKGATVNAKNQTGIWAFDSTERLRQVIRTGDMVDGEPITGITALTGVQTALGASRGFNARGTAVVRLQFPRGGQRIVRINLPDGTARITTQE